MKQNHIEQTIFLLGQNSTMFIYVARNHYSFLMVTMCLASFSCGVLGSCRLAFSQALPFAALNERGSTGRQ